MTAMGKGEGKGRGRASGRRKRPRARSTFPWVRVFLFLVLLLVVSLSALGLYYHTRFNRLIEARLKVRPPQPTAVYSAPFRLNSGQPMNPERLVEILRRLGYRKRDRKTSEDSFQPNSQGFEVRHSTTRGTEELQIQCCPNDRITGLRQNGRFTNRVALKAEFLSNLYNQSREKKKRIRFQELPRHLVLAVLAAEDADFFTHSGIDWISVVRAAFVNLIRGSPSLGGSTLTQQFVKNFFLTPEKNFRRKFEELLLSLMLERRFSKEQIFELYANEVYQGQAGSFGIVGFGQAAQIYFGKNVKDVSLAESALLAGIIQAPNRYSPFRNSQAARDRRNLVLDLMEKNGFIETRQNALARAQPIEVLPLSRQNYREAPYFVDFVRERLTEEGVDWSRSDLEVFTTLDPQLQRAAYFSVEKGLGRIDRRLERRNPKNQRAQVALLAVDPETGSILAMIGGRDYAESQFNRATHAFRQPGSTFKPFVYAAALEAARQKQSPLTLASLILDEPFTFQFDQREYSPANSGGRYYGPVTVRQALARSLNVPTVKLAQETGYEYVAGRSREVGFRNVQPFPSIALGAFEVSLFELAQAYTAFANNGTAARLHGISGLRAGGEYRPANGGAGMPLVGPQVAFLVTSALESVLEEGTGRTVREMAFTLPAAGKTGSSNDSWFVGYTPELLCAVWVGFDDSSPLGLEGSEAALPIWTEFMKEAQRYGYLSGSNFPMPKGIVSVEIDPLTGLLATPDCPEVRTEYFLEGTEPALFCQGGKRRQEMALQIAAGANLEPSQAPPSQGQKKKKGKGFWGWVKKILP